MMPNPWLGLIRGCSWWSRHAFDSRENVVALLLHVTDTDRAWPVHEGGEGQV